MSGSSITSPFSKASKIKKLNGPEGWVDWSRALNGHLGIIDLWTTLTGEEPVPLIGSAEHLAWESHQRKLASLLLLTCGPAALSLIKPKRDDTATEQYSYLKTPYNTTTIATYSTLYRQINRCSLSNHESLKEYGDEVINARNKLKELKRPLDELHVSCAFLDGLDASYQAWKDMFLASYARNPTRIELGIEVMIIPTIDEILKLLLDRESRNLQSSSANQEHSLLTKRALGSEGQWKDSSRSPTRSSWHSKDTSRSSTQAKSSSSSHFYNSSNHQPSHCDTCFSKLHHTNQCWYTHPKWQSHSFKRKYPNADAVKTALEEAQRANKEKQNPQSEKDPVTITDRSDTGKNKDSTWYLDSATPLHITHSLKDYVYPDLDDSRERIENPNGDILRTRGAGTVALEVMTHGIPSWVHVYNVHYCPEMTSNLISLGTLEANGFEFKAKNGYLNVKGTVGDIILQSKRQGAVYPLLQPNMHVPGIAYKATPPPSLKRKARTFY